MSLPAFKVVSWVLGFPSRSPLLGARSEICYLDVFLKIGKNIKERHKALNRSISKHQTDRLSLQTVDQTFYLPRTKLTHCVSFGVDHIS